MRAAAILLRKGLDRLEHFHNSVIFSAQVGERLIRAEFPQGSCRGFQDP
jgi:hypothetical protein